jgi:hypothetical protein
VREKQKRLSVGWWWRFGVYSKKNKRTGFGTITSRVHIKYVFEPRRIDDLIGDLFHFWRCQ